MSDGACGFPPCNDDEARSAIARAREYQRMRDKDQQQIDDITAQLKAEADAADARRAFMQAPLLAKVSIFLMYVTIAALAIGSTVWSIKWMARQF